VRQTKKAREMFDQLVFFSRSYDEFYDAFIGNKHTFVSFL
jgi:hypothetical protein